MTTFKDLSLSPQIQKALEALGFTTPTEIQEKAIPVLLEDKKIDFHGQAQTGTGKTLAFGIPLLQKIDTTKRETQALIVAPTRELALQILDSLKSVGQFLNVRIEAIYGGASTSDQIRALKSGAHIVVGTPGRLNDLLSRKTLNLDNIKILVLDEADIMLDMGFKDEVDEILNYTPKTRAIWLFSATVKGSIGKLMSEHMPNPVSVKTAKKDAGTETTKQYFCMVPMKNRLQALCRFIATAPEFYGFIFCQTKILTAEIAQQLESKGFAVGALHGDMSQAQRNSMIKKFKDKEITILVATDVAARGIDIANLSHVVNFSLPEDHESYVHRIGRTGRAGKDGIAITFINKTDVRTIQYIAKKFNLQINPIDIPSKDAIIAARISHTQNYVEALTKRVTENLDSALVELVNNISDDNVKSVLVNILNDKYFKNIDVQEISYTASNKIENLDTFKELYINIGADDGVTKEDVVTYLKESDCITEDNILKIRVIKKRTFIEVPNEYVDKLINALKGNFLCGRRVNINIVEEREQSGERPSRFGSREGGRREGGRREGGYRGNREGASREGGYRGSREGGYRGSRDGSSSGHSERQPRSENGFGGERSPRSSSFGNNSGYKRY